MRSFVSIRQGCLAVLASNLLALTAQAGPAGALEIRLKDTASDRIERQRRARTGKLPLPGTPDLSELAARLEAKGMAKGRPVLIRIFKAEAEFEVWMDRGGRFEHFATYPICHWSGTLGPKMSEGDKQSPEGFYAITKRRLHHSGKHSRSLNIGFPNAFDKSLKRTGSYILVHGGCSSVGCYAMTDAVKEEIYDLVVAALDGGQAHIPVHVFPFHMTETNYKAYAPDSEWKTFWSDLKDGYESFNRTRQQPEITICKGRYNVRDASDGDAQSSATKTGPAEVCPQTAKVLRAIGLLERIARRPSRWRKLTPVQKTFLLANVSAEEIDDARNGQSRYGSQASPPTRRGINRRTKKRVACDMRKPSCKRFMRLRRMGSLKQPVGGMKRSISGKLKRGALRKASRRSKTRQR